MGEIDQTHSLVFLAVTTVSFLKSIILTSDDSQSRTQNPTACSKISDPINPILILNSISRSRVNLGCRSFVLISVPFPSSSFSHFSRHPLQARQPGPMARLASYALKDFKSTKEQSLNKIVMLKSICEIVE